VGEFAIARSLNQPNMAGLIGGITQVIETGLVICLLKCRGINKTTKSAGSLLWFSALGGLATIDTFIGSHHHCNKVFSPFGK
jgi:hypothetical protein